MKRITFSAISMLLVLSCWGQNVQWPIGHNGGLKFNGGAPISQSGFKVNSNTANTAVCDVSGNIVFYSDGMSIWNKTHGVVKTGLLGGPNSAQGALAVPVPGANGVKYLLFTTAGRADANFSKGLGICLVTVDPISKAVTASTAEQLLPGVTLGSGGIAVTDDGQGGYWLTFVADKGSFCILNPLYPPSFYPPVGSFEGGSAFESLHITNVLNTVTSTQEAKSVLNTFEVTNAGLLTYYSLPFPDFYNSNYGQIKFSKQGTKIAFLQADNSGRGHQFIYSFNKSTGRLSQRLFAGDGNLHGPYVYGVEFSENGNYCYFSVYGNTNWANQSQPSSINDGAIIDRVEFPFVNHSVSVRKVYETSSPASSVGVFNGLQRGPDGKIYISGVGENKNSISVINDPNTGGNSIQENIVTIAGTNGKGLPTVINEPINCTTTPLISILSSTNMPIQCNGNLNGAITLTNVTGGIAPYYYIWKGSYSTNNSVFQTSSSPTLQSTLPGNYEVTIVDANGCGKKITGLNIPDKVGASPAITSAICSGQSNGTIILGATGGVAPRSIIWKDINNVQVSTGFNLLSKPAGTYTATITDQRQCSYTTPPLNISNLLDLTVNSSIITPKASGLCSNGSVTLSPQNGALPYIYFWNGSASGVSSSTFSNISAGNYTVRAKDANGCFVDLQESLVCDMNAMIIYNGGNKNFNSIHSTFESKVYPNPSSEGVYKLDTEIDQISNIIVLDVTGRILKEIEFSKESNTINIDINEYPSGTYFLNVFKNDTSKEVLNLIK